MYPGARIGELLVRLPSLTRLELYCSQAIAYVGFLPQLPRLTVLKLDCYVYKWADGGWSIPADAVFSTLSLCTCIIELDLGCGFNSAHWSALFAKLALKKLTIRRGAIETLQCFASGPITHSLEELIIGGQTLDLPPSELSHLYALRRLRTLQLQSCFSSRLEDAMLDRIFPPTPLFPALTELIHMWETAQGERESRERQGRRLTGCRSD